MVHSVSWSPLNTRLLGALAQRRPVAHRGWLPRLAPAHLFSDPADDAAQKASPHLRARPSWFFGARPGTARWRHLMPQECGTRHSVRGLSGAMYRIIADAASGGVSEDSLRVGRIVAGSSRWRNIHGYR